MKKVVTLMIVVATTGAMLTGPVDASKLTDLGKAATYPAKKVMKNTGHNVKQPVKSVTGPVNQAGQTTTRTLHKVTN